MKKFIPIILAVIAGIAVVVVTVLFLTRGASSPLTRDEAVGITRNLVEKSYEINEIYFGKGLALSDDVTDADISSINNADVDVKPAKYLAVSPDCGYANTDAIRAATAEVYSSQYCEYLYQLGFEGITSDDQIVVYARYCDDYEMGLSMNSNALLEDSINRTYDFDSLELIDRKCGKSSRGRYVTVSLQSYKDGAADEVIELKLLLEADGWRLDTPTY